MNSFFANSNLLFNHIEKTFREHDRMFQMMHERMQAPERFLHRSNPTYHTNRSVRNEKRIEPRYETVQPKAIPKLCFSIDKYESNGKPSIRTTVHSPRSKSASRAGAKRKDTLAREGIKPSIINTTSGKSTTLPKVAKPNSGKYSDDNLPATEVLMTKESLGYGWYQITKLDTGHFHVHSNQIQLESTLNASLLCIQEPKLRQTRKACYHTMTPYYQISFQIKQTTELQNMINVVIGYKHDQDYLVVSIDLLQKTVTLYACTQLITTLEQLLSCSVIHSNSFHDIVIHTQQFLQSFSRYYQVQMQVDKNTMHVLVNELVLLSFPSVMLLEVTTDGNETRKSVDGLPGILCMNRSKNIIKDWKVTSLLVDTDDGNNNDVSGEGKKNEETVKSHPVSSSILGSKESSGMGMHGGHYQSSIPPIQSKPSSVTSNTTTTATARPVPHSSIHRPNTVNTTISTDSSSTTTITIQPQNNQTSKTNLQDIPPLLPRHTINHTSIQQQLLQEKKYDATIVQLIAQEIVQLPQQQHQQPQQQHGVHFDDIISLDEPKRILQEAIVLPVLFPELFVGIREPWKGILLFGPPGTGKTMLAKAVANMHHCTFFNCSTASLISKWRGESEKLIHCLFDYAQLAAPSIIFLDEVDALLSSRGGTNSASSSSSSGGSGGHDSNSTVKSSTGGSGEHESSRRMKTEFLSRMDGLLSTTTTTNKQQRVMVLATTNCPWDLDIAILRRLEKRIYIPLPDWTTRKQLFLSYLQPMLLQTQPSTTTATVEVEKDEEEYRQIQTQDVDHCATQTNGYSSADIFIVCKDAAMMPMRRLMTTTSMMQLQVQRAQGTLAIPQLWKKDVEDAIQQNKPSVSKELIAKYEQWNATYGSSSSVLS